MLYLVRDAQCCCLWCRIVHTAEDGVCVICEERDAQYIQDQSYDYADEDGPESGPNGWSYR